MPSTKLIPIIEKLEEDLKKIRIKRIHNLLTVTSSLGMAFKKYKTQKRYYYRRENSFLEI